MAFFFLFLHFPFTFSTSATAQHREYFTDEEIELIRDNQQIDNRIDVLVKAIDRRFGVLNISVNGSKKGKEWGNLPTGTRSELLSDIRNILQKAIDDIDNLSARPDSMVLTVEEREKKPKRAISNLFPKAVRSLAKAAERYKPALKQTLDTTKDQREKGLILDMIDMCSDIIESVKKL